MRSFFFPVLAFLLAGGAASTEPLNHPVRMVGNGTCYCAGGAHYHYSEESRQYPSINACLADGGREPWAGQGECPKDIGVDWEATPNLKERLIDLGLEMTSSSLIGDPKKAGKDCLSQREAVLAKLSLEPIQYSDDGCRVLQGIWIEFHTGKTHDSPRRLVLGHLVPMRFALSRGADDWSEEKTRLFLNDPGNLFSVATEIKQQRSDSDLLEWKPPVQERQCHYFMSLARIIDRYDVNLSRNESNRLFGLIGDACLSG